VDLDDARVVSVDLRPPTAGCRFPEYFPEVCPAIETAATCGVVLDGELAVWEQQALTFARMGRRITAGAGLGQLAQDHPNLTTDG
jgi:ATP-dependent DNA ligase